jgi:acetyl esterase/lipase
VAFAQATAADHGGDPDRVTMAGYSTGGYTVGIHALIGDDPPLPPDECLVEPSMELPGAVVAGGAPFFVVDAVRGGAFAGNPQWGDLTPGQLDAFDPYPALGRNPEVRYVIVDAATSVDVS